MEAAKKQLAVATRFFKVMMPGFHNKLKLPPALCKKLRNLQKSQTVTLHSRIGAWKIKMCEEDDDDGEDDDDDALIICFTKGWPEFVDRHALSIGDFVVFEHTGELHFDVCVLGSNECEREFLVDPKKEKELIDQASSHDHPKSRETSVDESPCFFVKKMVPSYGTRYGRVNIPAKFARLNNLENKESVILRESGGREWEVKIWVERGRFGVRMATGWHDFYASNGLNEGDVCVFQLNDDDEQTHTNAVVFNVQITRATI